MSPFSLPKKSGEYDDLKELSAPWDVVYGPVPSRRLGLSLGINLLGSSEKVCNFDCVYCDLGPTQIKVSQIKKKTDFPTLKELEESLSTKLVELTAKKVPVECITFSGQGEPTVAPEFDEAVALVKKLRDELAPGLPIKVLTNGAELDQNKIIRALNLMDECIVKVDAGQDAALERVNAPLARMNIAKLIQGAKKIKKLTIQSMFIQGAVDNTGPTEIDEWMEVIGLIKPSLVQIYSLDRVPQKAGLKQVPYQRLKEISQNLTKRTLIKATVFA